MSQSVSLMATSQMRQTDLPGKYRGVISNGGLAWWVGGFDYRTAYEAEEAARQRLIGLLDDLREAPADTAAEAPKEKARPRRETKAERDSYQGPHVSPDCL